MNEVLKNRLWACGNNKRYCEKGKQESIGKRAHGDGDVLWGAVNKERVVGTLRGRQPMFSAGSASEHCDVQRACGGSETLKGTGR